MVTKVSNFYIKNFKHNVVLGVQEGEKKFEKIFQNNVDIVTISLYNKYIVTQSLLNNKQDGA